MMKKIIITGGLGYLGSELCKIYSGIKLKRVISFGFTALANNLIKKNIHFIKNILWS
jgi:FlaA1/EpsC-like NDP-sugar epimerase